MDAFRLYRRVIEDYHDYATSFITIKDEDIDRFVRAELAQGALWPQPCAKLARPSRRSSAPAITP